MADTENTTAGEETITTKETSAEETLKEQTSSETDTEE